MNSIKLIFRALLTNIKLFFKNLFNTKKGIIAFITYLSSGIVSLCFLDLAFSNLGFSVNETIAEQLYADSSADPESLGVVYAHESFKETWELNSVEPEKSKKLRSMDVSDFVYDVYPSNFLETSPAVVDYRDKSDVPISFLLLPKGGYLDAFFSPDYKFTLLAGSTDNTANIEDIYINKSYADFLLDGSSDYKSLVGTSINLPYYTQYITNGCAVGYKIKGILDENDTKYQYFKKYIGDFFLANQYLTLPIKSCTFFKLADKFTTIKKQVNAISRVYKYDVNLKRFNSIENMYTYEYRIMCCKDSLSNNNLNQIENQDNIHFQKYQLVYDYFFYKNNVIKLIVFSVLTIITFSITVFSLLTLTKNIVSLKAGVLFFGISLSVIFSIDIFLNKVLSKALMINPYISPNSWQCFVAMFIVTLALFVISILLLRKRNKYGQN